MTKFSLALVLFIMFQKIQAENPADVLLKSHSAPEDQFSNKDEMHGIEFSTYRNFYSSWKLVTVRYRLDTNELRFTYANPLAWESLKQGLKDYPKGSVFAKIGFVTQADPSFTSSAVPSGAKRYQFMVRDKEKFSVTDGWGYALFNGKGKTFPGDPTNVALACAACHRAVPDRGFVFSQNLEIEPLIAARRETPNLDGSNKISFTNLDFEKLPAEVKGLIPSKFAKIRELNGPMKDHLFEGTLDEIRPALIEETLRTSLPSALISKDQLEFSFIYPGERSLKNSNQKSKPCSEAMSYLVSGLGIVNPVSVRKNSELPPNKIFKISHYCVPNPTRRK